MHYLVERWRRWWWELAEEGAGGGGAIDGQRREGCHQPAEGGGGGGRGIACGVELSRKPNRKRVRKCEVLNLILIGVVDGVGIFFVWLEEEVSGHH